jgi:hypothetical protein
VENLNSASNEESDEINHFKDRQAPTCDTIGTYIETNMLQE